MKLIDADALLKFLEEHTDDKDWLVGQYNADWVWSFIDSAPTIDAVEVVRCKDCEHKGKSNVNDDKIYCKELMADMDKKDFCSCGKRKEAQCGLD